MSTADAALLLSLPPNLKADTSISPRRRMWKWGVGNTQGEVMKNRVLGMWRPETITATIRSKMIEPFGPKPTGLLCFHESLHFVELMSDPTVPRFASNAREAGTPEEDKAAVIGNLALFGTYTVDSEGNFTGNLVQGCTFPNWIGDQRTAEQLKEVVDGDHMLEIFQSGDVRVEIHWQRVVAA